MIKVEGTEEDQPGIIADAFAAALPFNIGVAETVTLEAGDEHNVSIVCEPFGLHVPKDPLAHVKQNLVKHGLGGLNPQEFLKESPPILWHDVFQVDHGWIWDTCWRERIEKIYPGSSSQVDLNKAVVSADTEHRLLRFLFPRKGAVTVRIEHADRPGALRRIADVFRKCELNVLSALLRRGGAKPKNALLVAICEPHSTAEGKVDLKARLSEELDKLPHELRAHSRIFEADDPDLFIYSHHPDELVARIPDPLRPLVAEYKKNLTAEAIPIFISRRFLTSDRRTKIVKRVHRVLESVGCTPVEAKPEPGHFTTSIMQVSAKMWLARAGIVLVSGGVERAFSMNLAHEAGFLQGQGKPILVLVEDGSQRDMEEWTNAYGLVAPRFPDDDRAFDPENANSIDSIVTRWAKSIKHKNNHAAGLL